MLDLQLTVSIQTQTHPFNKQTFIGIVWSFHALSQRHSTWRSISPDLLSSSGCCSKAVQQLFLCHAMSTSPASFPFGFHHDRPKENPHAAMVPASAPITWCSWRDFRHRHAAECCSHPLASALGTPGVQHPQVLLKSDSASRLVLSRNRFTLLAGSWLPAEAGQHSCTRLSSISFINLLLPGFSSAAHR